MRFLADAGVSPKTVEFLKQHGHDAVHVRTLGLQRAPDPELCVDLTDRFRHSVRQGRLTHPPNDTHWSAEGHAIAAAAVHDVLRERGWLMSCNAKTEQWPFARIAKSTAKQVRH